MQSDGKAELTAGKIQNAVDGMKDHRAGDRQEVAEPSSETRVRTMIFYIIGVVVVVIVVASYLGVHI